MNMSDMDQEIGLEMDIEIYVSWHDLLEIIKEVNIQYAISGRMIIIMITYIAPIISW